MDHSCFQRNWNWPCRDCHKDFCAAGEAAWLGQASPNVAAAVVEENATPLDLVNWFKQRDVFRCIHAHADSINTQFDGVYSVPALEAAAGGHPFYWHRSGDTYTPGFAEQGVNANLFLNRTLWINHLLDLTPPSFVVHEGCEVNRPDSGTVVPYAGPRYARFQNAGRILVCNNALAIVSRAKVFYDGLSPLPQAFELASSWSSAAQPSPEHDAGVLPIRAFGGLPR